MYAQAETLMPVIFGMWHGQHFLMPFLRRRHPAQGADLAPSRRRDQCDRRRASGGRNDPRLRRARPRAPAQGRRRRVPRDGRRAGAGLQHGAHRRRAQGLPRRRSRHRQARQRVRPADLSGGDRDAQPHHARTTGIAPRINLPFGRGAIVGIGPIYVPADADDAALEAARRTVESGLNAVTARAYEIVDGRWRRARRGDGRA